MTGRGVASYICKMVLPALSLIVVGAAGLCVGWLGREWVRRRSETAASVAAGTGTDGRGVRSDRPARTLAWCPICHAHMAPDHRCRAGIAEGETATRGDTGEERSP